MDHIMKMFLNKKVARSFRNYSNSAAGVLYILSAVRTPIVVSKGVLSEFTASHLFSFILKEALQRALVPPEDISSVFLNCLSHADNEKEIKQRAGLPSTVKIFMSSSGPFINSAKFLQSNEPLVTVAGGTVSVSNYEIQGKDEEKTILGHYEEQRDLEEFVKIDYKNFLIAKKNGKFYDEIAKVMFRIKGKQILVEEDELPKYDGSLSIMNHGQSHLKYLPTPADGAVAFVIAAEDYIQRNQLMPIARVISFAEEQINFGDITSAQLHAIEKALQQGKCDQKKIKHWEVEPAVSNLYPALLNQLNVDLSSINKDGGVLTSGSGYPIGFTGAKGFCHLIHSLHFGELGCAASCDFNGSASAVIIKKCYPNTPGKPRLSLFTKKPCPLCVDLKEELKPFEGRFTLKEIDIEKEGNEKYKELFKYEIPVLFLEGNFLCKHKLDAQHFNRRLSEFENFA